MSKEKPTQCEQYGHYCPNCDNSFRLDLELQTKLEAAEEARETNKSNALKINEMWGQEIAKVAVLERALAEARRDNRQALGVINTYFENVIDIADAVGLGPGDHCHTVATAVIAQLNSAKDRIRELIQVMDPAKSVRYASYGCLTDDCGHWNDKTCTTESKICLLGRVLTERERP